MLKTGMLHQRILFGNIIFPAIDKRVIKEYGGKMGSGLALAGSNRELKISFITTIILMIFP